MQRDKLKPVTVSAKNGKSKKMENQKKIEMLVAAEAAFFTSEFANSNIKKYLALHGADIQSFNMKLRSDENAHYVMKIADENAHYVMKIADENAHYVMKIADETIKEVSRIVKESAELASKNLQEFIRLQKEK